MNKQSVNRRIDDLSWSAVGMGLLAAVVGFTSSFAVVLQGFRVAGASEAEAASGLMALSIGMGVSGLWLALRYRMPIGVAWSLPGSALLIASAESLSGIDVAIGTYMFSAVLLIVAGVFRPLGRLIESIPASLANAMLAGVLLMICLSPLEALVYDPWLAVPLLFTWWLTGRFYRLFAVPAALLVLIVLIIWRIGIPEQFAADASRALVPNLILITPKFDVQALISIGIPLFVVTMASQNVPGVAVLRAHGYTPTAGPLISNTGFFSLLAAPFGAHAINLAAVTAAMFASEDAHPDPDRRYWASVVAGSAYIGMGLLAGFITLAVTLVPPVLVQAIAGLALLGSFTAALVAAFKDPQEREASAVTFLFAASGMTFIGVGGAFWGLLLGGMMIMFERYRTKAGTRP